MKLIYTGLLQIQISIEIKYLTLLYLLWQTTLSFRLERNKI